MKWSELKIGDVITKHPFGKHKLWVFVKPIGPRAARFVCLDTEERLDGLITSDVMIGWNVLRGKRIVEV